MIMKNKSKKLMKLKIIIHFLSNYYLFIKLMIKYIQILTKKYVKFRMNKLYNKILH